MIEEIVPGTASCAEEFADLPDPFLYPQEAAYVARAVPKRRREFATARVCARRALVALGEPPTAVPSGARGAPEWPAGVVGTITHCDGYRAAVVARSRDLAAVGVDAEPHRPLPDGVLRLVATPGEAGHLAELAAVAPRTHWDRLLFCAKEAVYKAWFPLTRQWLGFEQACVTIEAAGTFTARLSVPGTARDGRTVAGFTGRWLVRDGLVLAAVAVPSEPTVAVPSEPTVAVPSEPTEAVPSEPTEAVPSEPTEAP